MRPGSASVKPDRSLLYTRLSAHAITRVPRTGPCKRKTPRLRTACPPIPPRQVGQLPRVGLKVHRTVDVGVLVGRHVRHHHLCHGARGGAGRAELGRRVERPRAPRPQRLHRPRTHHGHGTKRRGRGRRGAGERPRVLQGQPPTRSEGHPHRKARRGEGEPRLDPHLAHRHGLLQLLRRGYYGGERGFDRARRHLAGYSGKVSVSATASRPATRRATRELESWE